MISGFITFTLLWVISCTALYFGLIQKNHEALDKLIEANKLYEDAKQKSQQAQRDCEKYARLLEQIEVSLNCPN